MSKSTAKPSNSSKNTIKEKFPRPKEWLSIEICKSAYDELKKLPVVDDPLPDFNNRLPNRLEGILGSVSQECFGDLVHPTIAEAAGAYFVMMIKGHPLPNGNKRCGILFTNLFLFLNGYELTLGRIEMYSFAILVAEEKNGFDEIKLGVTEVFRENIKQRQTEGSAFYRFFEKILQLAGRKSD